MRGSKVGKYGLRNKWNAKRNQYRHEYVIHQYKKINTVINKVENVMGK